MIAHFKYAASWLVVTLTILGVASESTIPLKSLAISRPQSTHTPSASSSTVIPATTSTAKVNTASLLEIKVSTTVISPASLPTAAALTGPHKQTVHGGFSSKLKKKTNGTTRHTAAETNLAARSEFNSNIVDSWLVVLDVGTPPQELELSLDLGSDGFVVESTLMPKDQQTTDYPIYNPNTSTTAHQISGYSWDTHYGGFSLEGAIFTDAVTLDGTSWSNLTMEVVTSEPTGSPLTTASGILGVAAHLSTGASPSNVPSFLGSIKSQLAHLVFTLWFNSTASAGSIDFGYIDKTKYTDQIAYTPLYNEGSNTFWSVNITGIGAADPKTGELISSNMTEFTAILDTGANQSELPQAALWGFYSGITGSIYDEGGYCYDYPCSVNTELPDLVLFIGEKRVVVPRQTYGYWETMNPSNGVKGVEYCTTHLRPSDYFNGGVPVIGQDIIEGLFLVLDWDNQQVGFANSTVREMDSDFFIPAAAAATCDYTTSVKTIDPYMTGCTGKNFGGECYKIEVAQPGCTVFNSSLNLASVRPLEDSNLRCTFHSSTQCDAPLSDATNVMYPGVSTLSENPQSVFCLSSGIEPENVAKTQMGFCGDGLDSTTGCGLSDQEPWKCSIMYAPSQQFKFNLTQISTSNGKLGTCYFYQDEYCVDLISPKAGIDMCGSDINGKSIDVDFGTYVGSHMCI